MFKMKQPAAYGRHLDGVFVIMAGENESSGALLRQKSFLASSDMAGGITFEEAA